MCVEAVCTGWAILERPQIPGQLVNAADVCPHQCVWVAASVSRFMCFFGITHWNSRLFVACSLDQR